MIHKHDRAAEALLNALIDWFTGNPFEDGLGYAPNYVDGLRRRYEERMGAPGRGNAGGGEGFKSEAIEDNRPPSDI